jgi:uncharacterized protein with HEPN domain
MLPLEIRKYLYDVLHACDELVAFTAGKTLADFHIDSMLRSAVERQFEIIGEALRQMIAKDNSLATRISDTKRIIAFRNRLIHGYADIDHEVVWGILETNLPRLHREVRRLLEE